MGTDFPDELIAEAQNMLRQLNPERAHRAFYVASLLVATYLGKNSIKFWQPGRPRSAEEAATIIALGANLFFLRTSPGFQEICRRLKDRDIRAAFYECLAASQLAQAGFEISAQPETGTKGEDFDFLATKGGQAVSVEVTALTGPRFTVNAVLNPLSKKRQQVPRDKPALIFCYVPEAWKFVPTDFDFWLLYIAGKFFANTRRINAVIFLMEHRVGVEGGGGLWATIGKPFPNSDCRFPLDLGFLFDRPKITVPLDSNGAPTSEYLSSVLEQQTASPYFKWVDTLVGN